MSFRYFLAIVYTSNPLLLPLSLTQTPKLMIQIETVVQQKLIIQDKHKMKLKYLKMVMQTEFRGRAISIRYYAHNQ